MKIAILTDIHGTTYWRYAQKIIDDYDKVIFLGDYFDNWIPKWPEQMDNACNIIAFKKQYPEKIDLCWANHDTSYYLNENCSGYQEEHAKDIKFFFNRHKDLLNVVYIYDNWIFSHAGISAKWMSCSGIKTPEEINALFKERPNFFKWVGPNGYGDNPNEGPLWIRPPSLMKNAVKNYNQAVGHSEFHDGPKLVIKDEQKFVFTDTGEHNHFTYIDIKTDEVEFEEIKAT
jgi:hypothetical protein